MRESKSLAYDYFSLGLLIYFLYTGKDLFRSENSTSEYKLEYNKFESKISTMSWDNISTILKKNNRF